MICVYCGAAASATYRVYAGKSIRLCECHVCNAVVDPYVEKDAMLLFIDLLLMKKEVYRHIIFNRIAYKDYGLPGSIINVFVINVLLATYAFWLRVQDTESLQFQKTVDEALARLEVGESARAAAVAVVVSGAQALFESSFLIGSLLATRLVVHWKYRKRNTQVAMIKYNYALVALLVANLTRVLLVPSVIWGHEATEILVVELFTRFADVVAIQVYLDSRALPAAFVVLAGFLVQLSVQYCVAHILHEPQLLYIV